MKNHYRHIDILKGICILIVIIEHAKWSSSVWKKALFPFWGRMAIPCFMIISGFVNSRSVGNMTLSEAYMAKNIIRKLKRYLIPYTIAFAIEAAAFFAVSFPIISQFFNHFNSFDFDATKYVSFFNLLKAYISGGFGPGNYYTPVLIQLVLLIPILVYFMKKTGFYGLLFSFFFCFAFEFFQYLIQMPNSIYRLLIFRHILTICFGIYYSLGNYKKNRKLNLLSLLIGFSYIILHSYYRWTPFFFNRNWADVSFIACLFYIPIVAHLLSKKEITCKPLETIGKASYHIYLTQMVYYNFIKKEVILKLIPSQIIWCAVSVVICLLFGILFYRSEKIIVRSSDVQQPYGK